MLFLALLAALALVVAWNAKWIYKWYYPSVNGKLPPGSMGLPYFGETLQFVFLNRQKTFGVDPFIKSRAKRYGSLFKTNILNQQVVITTDPALCRYIFLQDGTSIETGHLGSCKDVVGLNMWMHSSGAGHKYFKTMFTDHYSPLKQKELFLSEIGEIVHRHVDTWSKQESIELKDATVAMSYEIAIGRLLGSDAPKYLDVLKDKYDGIFEVLSSLPVDIPGFHFHKTLKDKKQGVGIFRQIVKERLYSTEKHNDYLDAVIADMKKENPIFNIDSAADFIFGLLFSSYGQISYAIVYAIKFISENPSVLKDLTDEHETVLRNKADPDSPLTWKDYKSMSFTSHVIDETLRLASLALILVRKPKEDIHTDDGYTIPAGWTIMMSPPAVHFNSEKYPDPYAFNPSRWNGQGSSLASKDFIAFGGGLRQCPGAEFSKLQLSVVIHYLVTKYRFAKIKGGEAVWNPLLTFPSCFQLKVTKNLVTAM
jgi:cytochrome P450